MKATQLAKGLRAAAHALTTVEGKPYRSSAGTVIRCPHCDNVRFVRRKASFHTSVDSLVGVLAPEVHALVCLECSRIEWFYLEPHEVEVEVETAETNNVE